MVAGILRYHYKQFCFVYESKQFMHALVCIAVYRNSVYCDMLILLTVIASPTYSVELHSVCNGLSCFVFILQ